MDKRVFCAAVLLSLCTAFAFSQAQSLAVSRVYDIEDLKAAMMMDDSSAEVLKPELYNLYDELEAATYLERSSGQHLSLFIGTYSVADQAWRLHLRTNFFDREDLLDLEFLLPYSDVLGKRFVTTDKMSEAQLADYEEKVTLYDELIHTRENVLQAELYFKIFRWTGASEYYFVPLSCSIINSQLKNKVVYQVDEKLLDARKIQLLPKTEVRNEKEILSDKQRAQKLLARNFVMEEKTEGSAESETEKKESENESSAKKDEGRHGVIVQVIAEKADWDYSDFNKIRQMQPNLQGSICFGITPWLFAGTGVGYRLYSNVYYIDAFLGFNYMLGKHVDSIVQVGLKARTDNTLTLHTGGGFEFKFGPLLLSLGYEYNWHFKLDGSGTTETNSFNIGTGLSW